MPTLLPKAYVTSSSRALSDALVRCQACILNISCEYDSTLRQAADMWEHAVPIISPTPLPRCADAAEYITTSEKNVMRFRLLPDTVPGTMTKVRLGINSHG
jgi:hypothetical protein